MKYLIALTVFIVSIILFITGYYYTYRHEDFVSNILAELFGMVVGIVITLLIVDKYISWNKQLEWKRFRRFVNDDLTQKLFMTIASFHLSFNINHPAFSYVALDLHLGKGKVSLQTVRKLNDLIQSLKSRRSQLSFDADQILDFFTRTQPQLSSITNNVLPRVLQYSLTFSKDHYLLEKLQTLETIHTHVISGQIDISRDEEYDPQVISSRFNEIIILLHDCTLILSEIHQINVTLNPEESPLDHKNIKRLNKFSSKHSTLKKQRNCEKEWTQFVKKELASYVDFGKFCLQCQGLLNLYNSVSPTTSKFNVYMLESIISRLLLEQSTRIETLNALGYQLWGSYTDSIKALIEYSFEIENKDLINYMLSVLNSLDRYRQMREQSNLELNNISNSIRTWKNTTPQTSSEIDRLLHVIELRQDLNNQIISDCEFLKLEFSQKLDDLIPSIQINLWDI